jgi:signal transduction histidine kinase/DNA-binding NarL/FixJ family response regulator
VLDPAGNLVLLNRYGRESLQVGAEGLGGNFFHHFFEEKSRAGALTLFKELITGKREKAGIHIYELTTAKEKKFTASISFRALRKVNGEILGVILTGSGTSAIPKEQNRIMSDFLARVTHEIRTPLNAIMGFTEQLKQTELDSRQEEFVDIIDRSSEHLLSLINDVLVLSKVESRELNFENSPFKLSYTVNYVFRALRTRAGDKNLDFRFDIDERLDRVLIGDNFRLRQILINMLNNAIKFTHHGTVRLQCSLQAETDNMIQVRFDVSDTGIGIEADHLEAIFEQFNQADSRIAKKYGGTGLGLTICSKLIELQKGTLSVTSQPGKGTKFTFTLPYRKGKEEDLKPDDLGTVDSDKLKGRSVLLVDDDGVNRLLGKTILEKLHCNYEIVKNGKEALERLRESVYDVILLDIHLPDINGMEVARFVRKEMKNDETRIIAVTAAVIQHDIENFYRSGINDFLIKPFKEVHLFNKICDVLDLGTESHPPPKTEIILKEYHEKKYDLTELINMAGDDREFANQMLVTFINNSESSILLLKNHLKNKNWDQIGEIAHKILPSYRHLKVDTIVSELLELKTKTLVEPDYDSVPGLLKKTIRNIKDLISELKNEIREA